MSLTVEVMGYAIGAVRVDDSVETSVSLDIRVESGGEFSTEGSFRLLLSADEARDLAAALLHKSDQAERE